MFDSDAMVTTASLNVLVGSLARLDHDLTDGERIDQLAVLERVKSAVAAAQLRVTASFVASQEQVSASWRARAQECSDDNDFDGWRAARDTADLSSWETQCELGADTAPRRGGRCAGADRDNTASAATDVDAGRGETSSSPLRSSARVRAVFRSGVAAQVALARGESPSRGGQQVRVALTLTMVMPRVLALLEQGVLSEWRASIIVRECAVLTDDLRSEVDRELAVTLGDNIGRLGDRELGNKVRAIAYRLDPGTVTDRARKAEADRRVSLRPAPDTMAYLTALLPAAQAVAAYSALNAAADTAKAAGDARGKGQVMADTLVERVTGRATADDVDVEVGLVMDADALFGGGDTPAHLNAFGPVPAQWVRDLIDPDRPRTDRAAPPAEGSTMGNGMSQTARVWVRRLFLRAADGELVGMDSRRRIFDGGLRRYVLTRDAGTCRTPWCDAPARHLDHVEPHRQGGPTTADNGQGLCVRCNLTKEHPGWRHDVASPAAGEATTRHTVRVTTPTGHSYDSTAPPLLPGRPPASPLPGESTQTTSGGTMPPATPVHSPAA